MDINYLIRLWQNSNYDDIIIKSLPLARGTDKIVIEPTLILHKNQKVIFGKELSSYEYLKLIFENSIFVYIEDEEYLIAKEIYRKRQFNS